MIWRINPPGFCLLIRVVFASLIIQLLTTTTTPLFVHPMHWTNLYFTLLGIFGLNKKHPLKQESAQGPILPNGFFSRLCSEIEKPQRLVCFSGLHN